MIRDVCSRTFFPDSYCFPVAYAALTQVSPTWVEDRVRALRKEVPSRLGTYRIKGVTKLEIEAIVKEQTRTKAEWVWASRPMTFREWFAERPTSVFNTPVIACTGYGSSGHAIAVYQDKIVDTLSGGVMVEIEECRHRRRNFQGYIPVVFSAPKENEEDFL